VSACAAVEARRHGGDGGKGVRRAQAAVRGGDGEVRHHRAFVRVAKV
jgi:hypothetical protein